MRQKKLYKTPRYNDNNTHLTAIFQDNPAKPLTESLHSGFYCSKDDGGGGNNSLSLSPAQCGLWGCKNWPAPFPGRMSYKATKPGLVSVLYLSMRYNYGIVVY